MNKKVLIEFANQINALRAESRRSASIPRAIELVLQADCIEKIVGRVAAQFNPKFSAEKFAAACRKGEQ